VNQSEDSRLSDLKYWLSTVAADYQLDLETLEPASSDASFRRYFRLHGGITSYIVMDAPPQHEDCRPFLQVGDKLRQVGVNVPTVHAENLSDGFLLLSDLGKHNYYHVIQQGLADDQIQSLYRQAIHALVRMQHADTTALPYYDESRLLSELELFPEWYVKQHCQTELTDTEKTALQRIFAVLAKDAAQQPTILVHRDYHSPNLMVPSADGNAGPGVIDYQDALVGPITYDIASLVMDARTTWEEPQQLDWAVRYWQAARDATLPVHSDFAEFHRAYEWTSLQRNLRILGVFARLSHRDGKNHYLAHIPRVQAYVRQVAGRYGPFAPLLRLLDRLEGNQVSFGYTF